MYLDGHSWYEARALAERVYEKADEEQRKSFKPRFYEGVEDKLRALEKAGFMLGIATNGVTKITEELLDDLDIGELFSVVVGADMVESSKPAPDMILHACKIAECEKSECLYIGDQATDMEAAKSASILLGIGVRNPDLDLIKGIEFIDSITEIEIIRE